MASPVNPSFMKQPLKKLEIPLSKFSDEVIPHHQRVFEQYKATVQKLVSANNAEQLVKEAKDKKRTIKQLKDLMYELDTLRTQVEDCDLDKFDSKTLSLRKIILKLISGYQELQKAADRISNQGEPVEQDKENLNPFEGAAPIQIQENIEDLKLRQHQETLNRVESIHRDIEDLHEAYRDLHEMVEVQAENVEQVEASVASARENVQEGARHVSKAHKYKAVAYPVTGAFLGGLLGGPIGLIGGLKVGGIAALGCAVAGYTGGTLFNKMSDTETSHQHDAVANNENNENNESQSEGVTHKKDI